MKQNSKVFTPPTFTKDQTEEWSKYLDEEGFVVIRDMLSAEELVTGLELFKKDMATISPKFSFESLENQTISTTPCIFSKGMMVFNGIGQSDSMWFLRTNQKIQSIFKTIHKTDEIVTSLDGASIFVSGEQKSQSWLHIDQNPKNKMYSVQGAFNYLPVKSKDDAGFVVVPKSHKTYTPIVSHSKDWIVCEDQPVDKSVKLLIPENCLTLWNSKTIHANEGMEKSQRGLNRITCYVTFLPKSLRSEETRSKRINAYFISGTTSHWANKCELKQYPYGFKSRYESRGFNKIVPKYDEELTESGSIKKKIPADRLELL